MTIEQEIIFRQNDANTEKDKTLLFRINAFNENVPFGSLKFHINFVCVLGGGGGEVCVCVRACLRVLPACAVDRQFNLTKLRLMNIFYYYFSF